MTTPQKIERDKTLRWGLGTIGALSGLLSFVLVLVDGFLLAFTPVDLFAFKVAPGIVFGLMVGAAIRKRQNASGLVYLGFVVASTASYFMVCEIALTQIGVLDVHLANPQSRPDLGTSLAIGAQCGLIGSAILTAFAFVCLPCPPTLRGSVGPVVAGTILGAILFPLALSFPAFIGVALLFTGWQTGYAASLATVLPSR